MEWSARESERGRRREGKAAAFKCQEDVDGNDCKERRQAGARESMLVCILSSISAATASDNSVAQGHLIVTPPLGHK